MNINVENHSQYVYMYTYIEHIIMYTVTQYAFYWHHSIHCMTNCWNNVLLYNKEI